MTLVWWVVHALVGFVGGWALGGWRGALKGKAERVYSVLDNPTALRTFVKGEIARKGGIEAVAKGVKVEGLFNATVDELFSRLETLRLSSLVAEYAFYVILVGWALISGVYSGAYLAPLVGIPVCFLTVKQVAKEKGEPQGDELILQVFGIFHRWLKHQPVEAFGYSKTQSFPVKNLINVLRESGSYAL